MRLMLAATIVLVLVAAPGCQSAGSGVSVGKSPGCISQRARDNGYSC